MAEDGMVRIAIHKSTDDALNTKVKDKFLKNNPSMNYVRISRNTLIKHLIKFYNEWG